MPRERKPLPALDNASTINNPDLPNIYNRNYTDTILKYGGLATRFPQLETTAKTVVAAINELYHHPGGSIVIPNPPIDSTVELEQGGALELEQGGLLETEQGGGGSVVGDLTSISIDGDIYTISGSGGTSHRTLTQDEYNDLSEDEKNNGTIYFISDAESGGGASSLAELDDVVLSELFANQVLTYDGENWVNSANPADFGDTTLPSGHFLWYDGVTWKPSPYFIIDLEYEPSQNQMLYYNGDVWGYTDAPLVTNVDLSSVTDPESGAVLYYDGQEWTADNAIRFHSSSAEDRELLSYDASTGEWVNKSIGNAIDLTELGDVSIDSPSDGDVLMYATGSWVNSAFNIPEDIEDLQDVSVSSPDDGQVLKYFDGQWINANESGGSTVSVTQIQSTGTKIATVSVDAVDTDLYAPNPGSTVSVNPIQSTGTKIATITVDSTSSDLYAPSAVSSVNVSQIQTVGTKIATITVDGSGTDLYAPTSGGSSTLAGLSDVTLTSPTNNQVLKYDSTNNVWVNGADSGGSVVSVTQIQSTGTKIATITVDSVGTDLYAPQSSTPALNDLTDVTISSPTNNQALIYDNANSRWVNGTVSGGHTIVDDGGTDLAQRTNLQFKGAYSEDNSVDDTTEVNVIRSMTYADFNLLSDDEKIGIINVTDITGGDDGDFQPVIYSEDEREIGVWVDGKPLYQKTVNVGTITTSTTVAHGVSNLETIIDYECFGDYAGTDPTIIPFQNPAIGYGFGVNTYDSTDLYLARASGLSSNLLNCYITIRYTKSTDQPGSGQWTPQGIPAQHYSSNEQVVGTWIDGSTVYETTVEVSGLASQVSNWTNIVAIANVDKIIDFSGCGFPASNNQQTSLGDFIRLCYKNGYLQYYSTAWSGTTLTIRATVRYTKTSS